MERNIEEICRGPFKVKMYFFLQIRTTSSHVAVGIVSPVYRFSTKGPQSSILYVIEESILMYQLGGFCPFVNL